MEKSLPVPDEALVARTIAGDTAAYAELIERYRGLVWAICLSYVPNLSGCDDIARDIFVKAYVRLDQLQSHAGETCVVYGSASLPDTTVDLNAAPGANTETRIYGTISGIPPNQLGSDMAIGEVDGDGLDDILFGVSSAAPQGRREIR